MKAIEKIRRNPLSINDVPDCYGNHAQICECADCFCEYECIRASGL